MVSRSTINKAGALVTLPRALVMMQSRLLPEAESGTLVSVSVALVAPARLVLPQNHWKAGGWKLDTVTVKLALVSSVTVALVG